MRIPVMLVLFLTISSLGNSQTENFWGSDRTPNHRIEARLDQNLIGSAKYPNPGLGFDLEFINLNINWTIYAGSGIKFNFNQNVSGLYLGPDIGLALYSRSRNNFVFSEFDIGFMAKKFENATQILSDCYGINLGYGKRYKNSGFRLFARYERNYTLSRDYYMVGGTVFINFRW
jgi:hypothetical protein